MALSAVNNAPSTTPSGPTGSAGQGTAEVPSSVAAANACADSLNQLEELFERVRKQAKHAQDVANQAHMLSQMNDRLNQQVGASGDGDKVGGVGGSSGPLNVRASSLFHVRGSEDIVRAAFSQHETGQLSGGLFGSV
jgi:hypothetical protein